MPLRYRYRWYRYQYLLRSEAISYSMVITHTITLAPAKNLPLRLLKAAEATWGVAHLTKTFPWENLSTNTWSTAPYWEHSSNTSSRISLSQLGSLSLHKVQSESICTCIKREREIQGCLWQSSLSSRHIVSANCCVFSGHNAWRAPRTTIIMFYTTNYEM